MATAEAGPQAETPPPNVDVSKTDSNEVRPKRKASHDSVEEGEVEPGSPKRAKHDSGQETAPERRQALLTPDEARERRTLARLEEKKRSKRLFGGLISTIGQTTPNAQQRRRQEIDRRQREKLRQQDDEGDEKRTERLARLHKVRMVQQIVFEEEVMESRHAKLLALAEFLRTRSTPQICYLPWKLTREQELVIDDQKRGAKVTIETEKEQFRMRKEEHMKKHGSTKTQAVPASTEQPGVSAVQAERTVKDGSSVTSPPKQRAAETAKEADGGRDVHDEPGDVLVDAEEDMVIY